MVDYRDALLSVLDIRSGGDAGDHDPYDALCAMFDIAHALYWLDPNSVPSSWGFRPSMVGGPDYAECDASEMSDWHCGLHSNECCTARELLYTLAVTLSDPYGDAMGLRAERELVSLGNELNPYALMSEV
jgi:hypothetical protein